MLGILTTQRHTEDSAGTDTQGCHRGSKHTSMDLANQSEILTYRLHPSLMIPTATLFTLVSSQQTKALRIRKQFTYSIDEVIHSRYSQTFPKVTVPVYVLLPMETQKHNTKKRKQCCCQAHTRGAVSNRPAASPLSRTSAGRDRDNTPHLALPGTAMSRHGPDVESKC